MNREILFRGKRVDNGEWVYGDLAKYMDGSPMIMESSYFATRDFLNEDEDGNPIIENEIALGGFVSVIPETVGQFIGLTDKNGTKIFEGDIRDFDGGLGQVIWLDAAFAIKSPGSEAVDFEHSSVFINSTLLTTIHDNHTP